MNRNTVRWLLGLALVSVIGMAVAWRDRFDVAALQTWVESAGSAAPLVFIALCSRNRAVPAWLSHHAGRRSIVWPGLGYLVEPHGATLGAALAF